MLEPRSACDIPSFPLKRRTTSQTMSKLRALLTIAGLLMLASGTVSAQALKVTCKDGTKSAGGQGACSSHGGIASKATVKADAKMAKTDAMADAKMAKTALKSDAKSASTALKADSKAAKSMTKSADQDAKGATAMCKDNTYSHAKSAQGMCSGHGGVAKLLTGK